MSRPYKIVIDPGHGGTDSGAVAVFPEIMEKDINLKMGLLFRRLVQRGDYLFNCYLSRKKDKFISLPDRVKYSKKKAPNAFVSFHCNSWSDTQVEGVEIFFKEDSPESRFLAGVIYPELMAVMPGHKFRGVKPGNFHVLRENDEPAILIEFEFLSNPYQAAYLYDEENQKTMVKAVADGLERFLEGGLL